MTPVILGRNAAGGAWVWSKGLVKGGLATKVLVLPYKQHHWSIPVHLGIHIRFTVTIDYIHKCLY